MPDDWDDDEPAPDEAARSLVESIILEGIAGHERSQQRVVGPSSLGTPCKTELAYRLMSFATEEDPVEQWRQRVGIAVHAEMELLVKQWKARNPDSEHKIFTERKVTVGEVWLPGSGMTKIQGTADLYINGVILDYKAPGISSIRAKRKAGNVGKQYEYQSHLYGMGYENEGLPVTHVAVLLLPNSGEWRDRYWWSEPYSAVKAQRALDRATKFGKAIEEFGLESVLDQTERYDNFCSRCVFALPGEWPQCPTAPEAKPSWPPRRSPRAENRTTSDLFR